MPQHDGDSVSHVMILLGMVEHLLFNKPISETDSRKHPAITHSYHLAT